MSGDLPTAQPAVRRPLDGGVSRRYFFTLTVFPCSSMRAENWTYVRRFLLTELPLGSHSMLPLPMSSVPSFEDVPLLTVLTSISRSLWATTLVCNFALTSWAISSPHFSWCLEGLFGQPLPTDVEQHHRHLLTKRSFAVANVRAKRPPSGEAARAPASPAGGRSA